MGFPRKTNNNRGNDLFLGFKFGQKVVIKSTGRSEEVY